MGLDFEVNNFFHDLWWHKIFEKGPAQYCILAETLILPLKKEEKRRKRNKSILPFSYVQSFSISQ
jgi:hypothetical protein